MAEFLSFLVVQRSTLPDTPELATVPIATRYDKTARNFLAAVHLAASAIWLN
jgi:hypothetical protein